MTTATTVTAQPSKAARFADAAEELGWEVERVRLPDGGRLVRARRGTEEVELAWARSASGALVFHSGEWTRDGRYAEEVTNVKATLRDMAQVYTPNGRLPFDPENSTDIEVIEAVAGKTIRWTNRISGLPESGICPRGGLNLRIERPKTADNEGARILTFASQDGTGFRSVALASIERVK